MTGISLSMLQNATFGAAFRPAIPRWGIPGSDVAPLPTIVTTSRRDRFRNQYRLRKLTAAHPDIRVFCAHNPWELEEQQRLGAGERRAVPA